MKYFDLGGGTEFSWKKNDIGLMRKRRRRDWKKEVYLKKYSDDA